MAVAFARKFSVVGCDANPDRIRQLRDGRDSAGEGSPDDFAAVSENLSFAASPQDARQCGVFIIAVSAPVSPVRRPDLAILKSACQHDVFRDIAEKDLGDALVIDVKGIAPRADWRQ